MSTHFQRAIVRTLSENFADGLTSVDLGKPSYEKALTQHAAYCQALEACGLTLTRLEADARFPDSTFVEDTAVLNDRCAIITNPGAPSRKGEETAIEEVLKQFYAAEDIHHITAPGTLDGGDICQANLQYFIGISDRTNEEGARQLQSFLQQYGYSAILFDVRPVPDILHLKSGMAYIGDGNMVLAPAFISRDEFKYYHRVQVQPEENYAANCVRVNESVLLPAGYPQLRASIEKLGYAVIPLEMSEFRKMDGGLSCLSLRF